MAFLVGGQPLVFWGLALIIATILAILWFRYPGLPSKVPFCAQDSCGYYGGDFCGNSSVIQEDFESRRGRRNRTDSGKEANWPCSSGSKGLSDPAEHRRHCDEIRRQRLGLVIAAMGAAVALAVAILKQVARTQQ